MKLRHLTLTALLLFPLTALHAADNDGLRSPAEVAAPIAKLKVAGTVRFESRHRRKDGSLYDVEVSAKHVRLGDSGWIVAFLRDITERKQAGERLPGGGG